VRLSAVEYNLPKMVKSPAAAAADCRQASRL